MRQFLFWLAMLAAYAVVGYTDQLQEPAAICDTDADCLHYCPPPMDDPDCDGGPS